MTEQKDRRPVSFWLNDKKVTGILAAEIGTRKLVAYGKRFYTVTGTTPDKKHFTESSLPAPWRTAMTAAAPASPPLPVAAGQGGASPKPEAPAPAAAPQGSKKAAAGQPAKARAASKRRQGKEPPAAQAENVSYDCPYCGTPHSCGVDRIGAPFFEKCSGCGKEFGVKISSRVVYEAVIAAFRPASGTDS